MNKNESTNLGLIKAFHDDADKRLDFLSKLYEDDHIDEAFTLCLSYIDSFAQFLLWPSRMTGKNFVDALINFGGDPTIGLVHPLQAIREFKRMKPFWNTIAANIEAIFPGPDFELLTQDQFLQKLSPHLHSNIISQIKSELWRTTMASIAYFYFRNPFIHGFGAGSTMSFSKTTYQGNQIPTIDFKRLYNAALKLHSELRRRSEDTKQFFGNDHIFYA